MKKYKFKAEIHDGRGGGAFVYFPYDVEQEFGAKGHVPVQATFDGEQYRGSLAKYGSPQHMLGVSKAIREKLGKKRVTCWMSSFGKTKRSEPSKCLPSFKNC
jgi:hypothetical protein